MRYASIGLKNNHQLQSNSELISAVAYKDYNKTFKWLEAWRASAVGAASPQPGLKGRVLGCHHQPLLFPRECISFATISLRQKKLNGETALSKAVMWAGKHMVDELLNHGAEASPLHRFAMTGNLEMVRKLCNYGADINASDENGCTPLLLASMLGQNKVVRLLLSSGADPNRQDKLGYTPIYQASRWGQTDIV